MQKYTTIRATAETADQLRMLAATLTGRTQRRVTQVEALRICCEVTLSHMDEAADTLTKEETPR